MIPPLARYYALDPATGLLVIVLSALVLAGIGLIGGLLWLGLRWFVSRTRRK
jgi:hypothetical protein